jgi:hypothetical protein
MEIDGARLCQGFNFHLQGSGTSIPLGWMWFRASWHSSTLLKGTDKEREFAYQWVLSIKMPRLLGG